MGTRNNINEKSKRYFNDIHVRAKFNFGADKNEYKPLEGLKYCQAVNQVLNTSKRIALNSEWKINHLMIKIKEVKCK